MFESVKKYWFDLEQRERWILALGALIVSLILFYAIIWQPWHKAISEMSDRLPKLRTDLQWMRQQSEIVKNGGVIKAQSNIKGSNESLLSILEKTARANKLDKSIQQITPGQNSREVRVVLEDASFNKWVGWIDLLYKDYLITVKQVTAERDDDTPDIAEFRGTFERL